VIFSRFRIINKEPEVEEEVAESAKKPISNHPCDLPMGVSTFCKAFPWHLLLDVKLQMVQIGAGFMRLFGQSLAEQGSLLLHNHT
jgi:guanylate cyclase soluble subunit alpha